MRAAVVIRLSSLSSSSILILVHLGVFSELETTSLFQTLRGQDSSLIPCIPE